MPLLRNRNFILTIGERPMSRQIRVQVTRTVTQEADVVLYVPSALEMGTREFQDYLDEMVFDHVEQWDTLHEDAGGWEIIADPYNKEEF
jgi:hypothetical protein